MTEHMEIAKTIRTQLMTLDKFATWAWGCKDWSGLSATAGSLGGLHFRVNGKTFKGHVHITLNASDLYDIEAKTPSRINRKTMEQTGLKTKVTIKDVFVTDLIAMLDSFIEEGAQQEDFDTACEAGVRGGTY